MDTINKLAEYFAKFPGIGPRQSRRFVYYLLRQKKESINEFVMILQKLKSEVQSCSSCYRYFSGDGQKLCSICADKNRSDEVLMVVEKDIDVENIEKSGIFRGRYFVLGGTVSLLDKQPERNIRSRELISSLKKMKENTPKEIVLALSATPEGEETGNYIANLLEPFAKERGTTISQLGRGLSTGSELEYSDAETIKNAFARRT